MVSRGSQQRWTDASALAHVARELELDVLEENLDGGSSARLFRARDGAGDDVAIKLLVEQPGVVDGHDLGSFAGKIEQMQRVRARAPGLAACYVPVLESLAGEGWAAYTMPWFESVDIAAILRGDGGGDDAFFGQYTAIVDDVFVGGYGAAASPTPVDHLATVNVGRFLRRFAMLERALPDDVIGRDELVVNGRPCRSARILLARLAGGDGPTIAHMAPPKLMFCAHGDANTRNMLVGPAADGAVDIRIIDPRGSCDPWDPIYDLAKALFSLSVWDPALRLGFTVQPDPSRDGSWDVGFRCRNYAGYRSAIHRFLPFLERHQGLADLLADDEHWRQRLLLTHDMHVLAEAPCRLSDPKPKSDHFGEPSRPAQLALGFYLLGTLLVNDLVEQLATDGEIDADRHLGLVTGELPTG
ncbi:MAG TPA: hypothetical protein VGO80_11415 [Solirubrobacteraceae bacterium]|jgi:hypothetical protein|nr:hypothetical protein [Solirubrobacteraceae bacterium]